MEFDSVRELLQGEYRPDFTGQEKEVTNGTKLETQVHELSLALAAVTSSAKNEKAAGIVLEEHLSRQKLEDSRTLSWQSEQTAKMEEETAQIREDAKKTIEMNLKKHQEQLHTEVLRYKKLLDEQAQEERKEMENKMNDVAIKAAMASQNEMTAINKLTIAK